MIPEQKGLECALVMSGGGARAAYQVGVLLHMVRQFPDLHFPILTGVSAGAINAAYLASHPGPFSVAVEDLAETWLQLSTDQVFRVDSRSLTSNVLLWGRRLLAGKRSDKVDARGFVDTDPLRTFLKRFLPNDEQGRLLGVKENFRTGRLKAFAITGVNYATGQTITWIQGRDLQAWQKPNRRSVKTDMSIEHIMASSALPFFFPAIQVGDAWYGDGGIRQAQPLAPALHLGAEAIFAISTRYRRTFLEADEPAVDHYPPPAQVIGVLMNAVFLDALDQDAYTLERVNRLLERLPEEEHMHLRRVELLVMRPSQDLGKLAGSIEPELPPTLKFLIRGLGSRETKSPDWLSMIMFERPFIETMIRMGEADAQTRHDQIATFLRHIQPHMVSL